MNQNTEPGTMVHKPSTVLEGRDSALAQHCHGLEAHLDHLTDLRRLASSIECRLVGDYPQEAESNQVAQPSKFTPESAMGELEAKLRRMRQTIEKLAEHLDAIDKII